MHTYLKSTRYFIKNLKQQFYALHIYCRRWCKISRLLSTGFGVSLIILNSCVTQTINNDGSVQSDSVDKTKLSETYANLAVAYAEHNAPQVGLDRANLAVSTNSDNPHAYLVRANIYGQLAKFDLAEADYKTAVNINSSYAEAYVGYGAFLCNQHRYSEAYVNFDLALNNPLYFTPEIAYFSRGKCEMKQNNLPDARRDFLKALNYRNYPEETYLELAKLDYLFGNFSEANNYIKKFSGVQTSTSIWLNIEILQALIDKEPSNIKAREYTLYRNALGNLLVKNYTNTEEAKSYIKKYNIHN